MKIYCPLFLVALLFATSCDLSLSDNSLESSDNSFVLSASFADAHTKTYLNNDSGEVFWSKNDVISLFFNSGSDGGSYFVTFDGGEIADFTGDNPNIDSVEGTFYGLYPFNPAASCTNGKIYTSIPASQVSSDNGFSDNTLVMAGSSTSSEMGFYHVSGGICFTVSKSGYKSVTLKSLSSDPVAGDIEISFINSRPSVRSISGVNSVVLSSETGFQPGKKYFISLLPTTLSHGFSLTFDGEVSNSLNCNITIERGSFAFINNADLESSFDLIKFAYSDDLYSSGTSNCYIVPSPGKYRIPVVKGNSSTKLSKAISSDVIWETVNTETAPQVHSIIASTFYSDGYLYFRIPDSAPEGNALLSVSDANGNILWSWHVWYLKGGCPSLVLSGSSARILDRNLGALSNSKKDIRSSGLFYQWGRKDPFPSSSVVKFDGDSPVASIAGIQISFENTDQSKGTIDFATSNPTVFLKSSIIGKNWFAGGSNSSAWTSSKTIYDPCPVGWRVPDLSIWQDCTFVPEIPNNGVSVSTTDGYSWFPCNGYYNASTGSLVDNGYQAFYWTTTAGTTSTVLKLTLDSSSINIAAANHACASGHSVRCVKE